MSHDEHDTVYAKDLACRSFSYATLRAMIEIVLENLPAGGCLDHASRCLPANLHLSTASTFLSRSALAFTLGRPHHLLCYELFNSKIMRLQCLTLQTIYRVPGAGGRSRNGKSDKGRAAAVREDMHHELLRYCATDITSAFSAGLIDAVRSPKLIFKVPSRSTLPSVHSPVCPSRAPNSHCYFIL